MAFGQTDPLERADVAAAEDGRTPLNMYSDSSLGDRGRTKRVPSRTKEIPSSLNTYPMGRGCPKDG